MKVFPLPLAALLLLGASLYGQDDTIVPVTVSDADQAAVAASPSFMYRALAPAGSDRPGPSSLSRTERASSALQTYTGEFYPLDLTPGPGEIVWSAQNHPIYVNMPPSHWGNVAQFIRDLGNSDFIHLIDNQYVWNSANNRYTLGAQFGIGGYPIPANHTLLSSDILTIVHAVAKFGGGTGLDHIYHVFLPQGVNMCLNATECYSPDNNSTFVFCAFHSSVVFSDIGEVVFTLEPYQNVNGCSVPPTGSASGQLNDSTANVLSHEMFETITDPNGDAWWVHTLDFANGEEIGDLCERAGRFGNAYYWNYGNVQLDQNMYTIQPEYSNQLHGCSYRPSQQ